MVSRAYIRFVVSFAKLKDTKKFAYWKLEWNKLTESFLLLLTVLYMLVQSVQ